MRPNMENAFSYTDAQWQLVAHLTVLDAVVMGAAFVYFLATLRRSAPRFSPSSVLSAVVMVSAAVTAFLLYLDWGTAFQWNSTAEGAGRWVPAEGRTFSNGFRYMNWSIDVPMLMIQLLFLVDYRKREGWSNGVKLAVSGVGMIWTSYAAQFWETAGPGGGPNETFYVFYAVSWAFYVYLLYVLYFNVYRPAFGYLSSEARTPLKWAWRLTFVSWMIYPIPILMPALWNTAEGAVTRQVMFCVADILSKAVYGIVLSYVSEVRSKEVGYKPAVELDWPPQDVALNGHGTRDPHADGRLEAAVVAGVQR